MSKLKKSGLLLIILILISSSAIANIDLEQEAEITDFRNVNWEMTLEEVLENEEAELLAEENEVLVYETEVAGLPTTLIYFFYENQLAAAEYRFNNNYTNPNNYIDDYSKLVNLLSEKYGPPTEDKTVWHNNLFENEPPSHGLAISLGHLEFWSKWATNDVEITSRLNGRNYNINFKISYQSTDFENASTEENYLDHL
ncbi:hypothetical protein [Fuchsiella alkaliacetigena]|uniref:hypothetical protein n=1 Tax=Fuchsiella alkaliacetigena TaxID=957042 RepID=UPI00200ACE35|nr:hypothetical protein [Fuchsiella alkaliacetigena]MCK8823978.1 hypothetical protein [Fuchsiella alkaliacetigena]